MDDIVELPVDPYPEINDLDLDLDELERKLAEWDAEQLSLGNFFVPGNAIVSALDVVGFALTDAAAAQFEANRAMAAQLAALAEVFDVARRNPHIYLTAAGMAQKDAVGLAERSAAVDAALQLHLSPNLVRTRAYEGQVLAESLPQLWAMFVSGATGYAQARAAVDHLPGIADPQAITRYDAELTEKASTLTPDAFRQKARTLAERLRAEPPELRHARSLADRRVVVEPAENGMAWLHAFVSGVDAMRIKARWNATAKNLSRAEAAAKKTAVAAARSAARTASRRAGLTGDETHDAVTSAGQQAAARHPRHSRDQIRADLLVAWLAGDGTPTAAKVRPILFVPLLGLLGKTDQPAVLQGYGAIDRVTAAQLFSDAPAFRRVGTDPFTGEILDFDRRRYRPSKAQRELLAIIYGTCAREGCTCLALTSDIDHLKEWARDFGKTNFDNLIPLCPDDHRLKTYSRIRYAKARDGSVTVTTPTGYVGRTSPRSPLPDTPAF